MYLAITALDKKSSANLIILSYTIHTLTRYFLRNKRAEERKDFLVFKY